MITAIRIGVLSAVMAIYMGWAFRGIEYDAMEAGPALLGYFLAFTILTAIAVPAYKYLGKKDKAEVGRFAFRFWLITASLVVVGWLIYYSTDPAAAGAFRANLIGGAVSMIFLVAVLNYAIVWISRYLLQKRR